VKDTRRDDVSEATSAGPRRDVFISHASEDKNAIARPLAEQLRAAGRSVWFDEYELLLGDSLREKISEGLRHSRVGLVILSPSFFAKEWGRWELDGLTARQIAGEQNVVLPVWHGVGLDDVRSYSSPLANLVAVNSSDGVKAIAAAVQRVLRARAAGGTREVALSEARASKDAAPALQGPRTGPIQRSVLVLEVEPSGHPSDPEIGELRSAMHRVLDEAVARAGLADASIDIEDHGDRALIVVDAPPLVLLDPFAERLIAVVREQNTSVEASAWLRLRVALHAGPVHAGAHGWSGDTIDAVRAICDAPPVKATLQRADRTQLVLAVSDLLYKQVVRHGYRSINPATYGPVHVERIGERAWVRVPGYPAPPTEPERPADAAAPAPPETRIGVVFGDHAEVSGGKVVGGDYIVGDPRPGGRHG
jgi:class 3 adenylate cyclase